MTSPKTQVRRGTPLSRFTETCALNSRKAAKSGVFGLLGWGYGLVFWVVYGVGFESGLFWCGGEGGVFVGLEV